MAARVPLGTAQDAWRKPAGSGRGKPETNDRHRPREVLPDAESTHGGERLEGGRAHATASAASRGQAGLSPPPSLAMHSSRVTALALSAWPSKQQGDVRALFLEALEIGRRHQSLS